MKQLTCEMCGSTDLMKQEGVFVCQYCGCKYSVEEAKKMMIEGTVDVTGSTIKVDTSDELSNLYQLARRAKDEDNEENAAKYYDMILVKDPTSWEASFYLVYYKAMGGSLANIESAANSVGNCLNAVMKLIKNYVESKEEQIEAVKDVAFHCTLISEVMYDTAKDHYNGIDWKIRDRFRADVIGRCYASGDIMCTLGNEIDSLFGEYEELHAVATSAWEKGITEEYHMLPYLTTDELKKLSMANIIVYADKIKKYNDSYEAPSYNVPSGGCYVATAVYGSYDCPQVWTLRRFRDYTLAETWYGRTFIRTYYAISPTLVKYFGHTEWFKKMWKGKLDRMVANLNAEGVENTPYEDKEW